LIYIEITVFNVSMLKAQAGIHIIFVMSIPAILTKEYLYSFLWRIKSLFKVSVHEAQGVITVS
jgi:hypothetical protein